MGETENLPAHNCESIRFSRRATPIVSNVRVLSVFAFLWALPWAWVDFVPSLGVALRPGLVLSAALMMFSMYDWRGTIRKDTALIAAIIVAFLTVILLTSGVKMHPHWSPLEVCQFGVTMALAWGAAIQTRLVMQSGSLGNAWGLFSTLFVISSVLSFSLSFGSVNFFGQEMNHRQFIHNVLNSGVFDEDVLKSLRHTMAMGTIMYFPLAAYVRRGWSPIEVLKALILIYFVAFTFSRSGWLILFLFGLFCLAHRMANLGFVVQRKAVAYFAILSGVLLFTTLVVYSSYGDNISALWSLLSSRAQDSTSAGVRLSRISEAVDILSSDYAILGPFNGISFESPHNFVLDSVVHSGMVGGIFALMIFLAIVFRLLVTVPSRSSVRFIAGLLLLPAIVRMLTAGGGLIGQTELLAMFLSLEMTRSFQTVGSTKDGPAQASSYRDVGH